MNLKIYFFLFVNLLINQTNKIFMIKVKYDNKFKRL